MISKLKGKGMSRMSFQDRFVESLGLLRPSGKVTSQESNQSNVSESFVSKFQRSMNEMEVKNSGQKLKKRKRSEDSGLDTSDYSEVISAGPSRKKKKKKKKGNREKLQENSPVGENDKPPVVTGSGPMFETSPATPSKETDKTTTSKNKKKLLSNQENNMFHESAEETTKPPKTPFKKKKKKRIEREETQEESEVTENNKPLVTMKEEIKSELNESDDLKPEDPGITINDLYRMPKKSKVSAQIYSACQFIMEQQVEVSLLNRVYRGHCVPRERIFREELKRKYNAKFGGYSLEQDTMILRRFKVLFSEVVTEGTPREFLQTVLETCGGKDLAEVYKSKFRTIGVRNIIGLYVGQVKANIILPTGPFLDNSKWDNSYRNLLFLAFRQRGKCFL